MRLAAPRVVASSLRPRRAEQGMPLSRHARIGILDRRDHPRDSGRDQRLGAGRRATMMCAGLKRYIRRCATRGLARLTQGIDFGMWLTGA